MLVLQKSFTREFTLALIQIWGMRYSSEFFGEKLPDVPVYVFFFTSGLVTAYRNPEFFRDVINPILARRIRIDSDFINQTIAEKSALFEELQHVKDKDQITPKDLSFYLNGLFEFWQVHYISQFVPLDEKAFNERDRATAIGLRKKIDQPIHALWNSTRSLLQKAYPEVGELADYLSWDEVVSKRIPNADALRERMENGVIVFNGTLVSEKRLEQLKKQYSFTLSEEDTESASSKITGQIACRGKVIGKVRKVAKESEVPFLQCGEVLVSYMTVPTFLPAMKRAVAFITDEGGITCHAAIVARELKKPCIIGTKIATKVLKDGMTVEVDADNGIVRILS